MRARDLYLASDELDHYLRRWLVSVNTIELMRYWIAAPGQRYWAGGPFIWELTVPRDHDELLHGASYI
jgi:hypothetical protein